jgi:hypothetical protein
VKKKRKEKIKIIWNERREEAHCAAAERYLSLLFSQLDVKALVHQLRRVPSEMYAAKDVLRASQTHLLDEDNSQVAKSLHDIKKGNPLSPVLLVRGNGALGVTVMIADGYHRICASWHWDEKCPIACCIASLEPSHHKKGK